MPSIPVWPHSWQRLRDQGRLQFSPGRTGLWHAVIPELGQEVYARTNAEMREWIAARVDKLPPVAEPKRVNGTPWPEALPASKNLLPRR